MKCCLLSLFLAVPPSITQAQQAVPSAIDQARLLQRPPEAAGITPFTLSASSIFMPNGLSAIGADGAAGGTVTLNAARVLIASGPDAINGVTLNGGDSLLGGGGDGGTLNLGTTANPIAGNVTINAPVTASTGARILK
ncbi:MAG: hypothetical protein ABI787_09450 [Spartobacteria bacterium]